MKDQPNLPRGFAAWRRRSGSESIAASAAGKNLRWWGRLRAGARRLGLACLLAVGLTGAGVAIWKGVVRWIEAPTAQPPVTAGSTSYPGPHATPSGCSEGEASPSTAEASPSAAGSSALAEENELFASAMTLKRQARREAALVQLAQLLARHPSTVLGQEARLERLRILRSLGRTTQARHEAQRYLTDFPRGYAAAEAHVALEQHP